MKITHKDLEFILTSVIDRMGIRVNTVLIPYDCDKLSSDSDVEYFGFVRYTEIGGGIYKIFYDPENVLSAPSSAINFIIHECHHIQQSIEGILIFNGDAIYWNQIKIHPQSDYFTRPHEIDCRARSREFRRSNKDFIKELRKMYKKPSKIGSFLRNIFKKKL